MNDRPIGVFDSGFGGLTVARAVIDLLPKENLVYIGDTGRYPYGPRPQDEVRKFARQITTKLITEHDVKPENIEAVKVYAGTNILKPIRYPIAMNHLQAKFSLPAALAMIALVRKAGKQEFSDDFVGSAAMQAMQRRIGTELDHEIEKMGFDKMRSRITIRLKNGRKIEGWADERYRGGPENPLSDADLGAKVRSCCEGVLDEGRQSVLIDAAWSVEQQTNVGKFMQIINNV